MTLKQDPPPESSPGAMPEAEPITGADQAAVVEPPVDSRAEPVPAPAMPATPEALALDNARGGRWAMNEYFDRLVWFGADGRPAMRKDGSRVGFYFHDAARLAEKLARDEVAAADPRRALAPLDAGLPDDWDPQVQKSTLATMTKMTRLMAYDYVRTTEPEEAVRKAVAVIFGNPRFIDEPQMKVWVPGKYDLATVKSVANMLRRQVINQGVEERDGANAHYHLATALVYPEESLEEVQAASTRQNPADGRQQVAQANARLSQQSQPKGERRPPGQYKERQKTNIQPVPPKVQPGSVVQALQQNHLTQAWREKLAEFETRGNPHDGYGTYLFQEKGFAYGRYQFRTGGLKDAGMMDMKTGDWTGKYGVNSWRDFLNNPQAQEAALKDLTQVIETRYMPKHLSDMGRTIKTAVGDIKITPGGFIGACHQAGTGRMDEYFQWAAANNWDTRGKPMPPKKGFEEIERRMKAFETIPYR